LSLPEKLLFYFYYYFFRPLVWNNVHEQTRESTDPETPYFWASRSFKVVDFGVSWKGL